MPKADPFSEVGRRLEPVHPRTLLVAARERRHGFQPFANLPERPGSSESEFACLAAVILDCRFWIGDF